MFVFPAPYVASAGPTDTGFIIAGAGASVNTGDGAWSNPGNITADDGTNATNSGSSFVATVTDDLKGSDFGFAIPDGATIDGIEVRAQLLETDGTVSYSYVNVGKNDATLATSKDPGQALDATPTNYDQGGAADLWGLAWTAAEINSSDFQVRIRCDMASDSQAECDAIWVKVYYTP